MRLSQVDPTAVIPGTPPPAGGAMPPAADPLAAMGQPGMPGMPGDIPLPSATQVPMPGDEQNVEPEKIYTALRTPEDIFKDYGLEQKLMGEVSVDKITNEIWTQYGGSPLGEGAAPDKDGTRPETGVPESQQESEYTQTENAKYKRLLKGTNIASIFSGTEELKQYVINFIKSNMNKGEEGAPGPMASGKLSWYRYAKKA